MKTLCITYIKYQHNIHSAGEVVDGDLKKSKKFMNENINNTNYLQNLEYFMKIALRKILYMRVTI